MFRPPMPGPETVPAPEAARPRRLAALDWFRFLAVALMVQGHTFYEVLVPEVKSAPWYAWHGYVHGFTAPMFYFSSGLAFGVTTLRGWRHHLAWTPATKKRFERYLMLLLIGYGMQAGDFSLRGLLHADPQRRGVLLAVNTLQNVGMTLLIAELGVRLCRTVPRYRAFVLALAVTCVAAAPALWRMDVQGWPIALAAWFTDRTGSMFPLFPWSAYAYAGILVSIGLFGADGRTLRADATRHLFLIGGSLAIGGKLLGASGWNPWGEHNYWKTSPFFFVQRLGIIVLVFALLGAIEHLAKPSGKSRVLAFVETVAQETLVIYVGHLLLLYGTPWTIGGLRALFPGTLSLGGSILAFLAVLLPMLAFGYAWHRVKKEHPLGFDRARYAVTALLIAVYLLSPSAR